MKETEGCLGKSARDISHASGVVDAIRIAKDCEEKITEAILNKPKISDETELDSFEPDQLVSQIKQAQEEDMIR